MIKMNWAQTPYIRNNEVGYDAKVAFDTFIKPEIFEIAKSCFEGYITKEGKKTALYHVRVISLLMEEGFGVALEGVAIEKSPSYDTLTLLLQSRESSNREVAKLSEICHDIKNRKDFENNFSTQLNALFDGKNRKKLTTKKEPGDIEWERFKVGTMEFEFDFKYGVERSITWEEPSHEDFVPVTIYRAMDLARIPQLKALLATIPPQISDTTCERAWQSGFTDYEAKKKMGYRN